MGIGKRGERAAMVWGPMANMFLADMKSLYGQQASCGAPYRPFCTCQCVRCAAVKFFSKSNNLFFGYFDPINIFLIIKINNFRGDLSDVSAKTATLVLVTAGSSQMNLPNNKYSA